MVGRRRDGRFRFAVAEAVVLGRFRGVFAEVVFQEGSRELSAGGDGVVQHLAEADLFVLFGFVRVCGSAGQEIGRDVVEDGSSLDALVAGQGSGSFRDVPEGLVVVIFAVDLRAEIAGGAIAGHAIADREVAFAVVTAAAKVGEGRDRLERLRIFTITVHSGACWSISRVAFGRGVCRKSVASLVIGELVDRLLLADFFFQALKDVPTV